MKSSSLIIYLTTIVFIFPGCIVANTDKPFDQCSSYLKISHNADQVLNLHSNIQKTTFFINSQEITGKRVKVCIDRKKSYTIAAKPEGYITKEEFIQPPYMDNMTLRFTFLLGDKILSDDKKIKLFYKSLETAAKQIAEDMERHIGLNKKANVIISDFNDDSSKNRTKLSEVVEDEIINEFTEYWHGNKNITILEKKRLPVILEAIRESTQYSHDEIEHDILHALITGEFIMLDRHSIRLKARMIELISRKILSSSTQIITDVPSIYLKPIGI